MTASSSSKQPAKHGGPSNAHPAFPSMPPPQIHTDMIPDNPTALRQTMHKTSNPLYLLPLLKEIARGTNQKGTTDTAKARNGEGVLMLWEWDLYGLDDQVISDNTGVILFVLSARYLSDSKARHDSNLFATALRLCRVGDYSQIGTCVERVGSLAWGIATDAMSRSNMVDEALMALKTLIDRTTHNEVFTPAYPAFLQLCLANDRHVHGLALTSCRFTEVAPGSRYSDILAFHHHAGTIAAASGEYKRAVELYTFAVSIPTRAVSAIQVACAKRAILCELLVSGKVLEFPAYTPSNVKRAIERSANATDYSAVAQSYARGDWNAVYKALDNPVFQKDANVGLILRVIESVPRRQILQLREVFSKISIGQLTRRIELRGQGKHKDCEVIVADLADAKISTKTIKAQMTPAEDWDKYIITFADPDEPIDPSTVFAELERNRIAINRLEQAMASANKTMGASETYLKKQAGMVSSGAGKSHKQIVEADDVMLFEDMATGGLGAMGGMSRRNQVAGSAALSASEMGY